MSLYHTAPNSPSGNNSTGGGGGGAGTRGSMISKMRSFSQHIRTSVVQLTAGSSSRLGTGSGDASLLSAYANPRFRLPFFQKQRMLGEGTFAKVYLVSTNRETALDILFSLHHRLLNICLMQRRASQSRSVLEGGRKSGGESEG